MLFYNDVYFTTLNNPDKIISRLINAQNLIKYFKEVGVNIDDNVRLKRAFFYNAEEFHIHNDLVFKISELNAKIPLLQKLNDSNIDEEKNSKLSKELLNFIMLIDLELKPKK